MVDFVRYDMEETSLATLQQSLLTIPFLVAHRLFVLKNTFSAPKATLDALPSLLESVPASTIVVLFEPKRCDQRLALYQWLKKEAKVQEYIPPQERELDSWLSGVAQEFGVGCDSVARRLLAAVAGDETYRLAGEVHKVASYVLSQGRTTITVSDVEQLCSLTREESAFRLGDSLRDRDLPGLIRSYRQLITQEDPLMLAGLIGSTVRTLAKLVLAERSGAGGADLARKTQLNPYVIKLSTAFARRVDGVQLQRAYRALIAFDKSSKDGTTPPPLGFLLLLIRLHVTLNKSGLSTDK